MKWGSGTRYERGRRESSSQTRSALRRLDDSGAAGKLVGKEKEKWANLGYGTPHAK